MRGLKLGRPFAWKILATASLFVASAPKPETVSVGKAKVPPDLISSLAFDKSGLDVLKIFVCNLLLYDVAFYLKLFCSLKYAQEIVH